MKCDKNNNASVRLSAKVTQKKKELKIFCIKQIKAPLVILIYILRKKFIFKISFCCGNLKTRKFSLLPKLPGANPAFAVFGDIQLTFSIGGSFLVVQQLRCEVLDGTRDTPVLQSLLVMAIPCYHLWKLNELLN